MKEPSNLRDEVMEEFGFLFKEPTFLDDLTIVDKAMSMFATKEEIIAFLKKEAIRILVSRFCIFFSEISSGVIKTVVTECVENKKCTLFIDRVLKEINNKQIDCGIVVEGVVIKF